MEVSSLSLPSPPSLFSPFSPFSPSPLSVTPTFSPCSVAGTAQQEKDYHLLDDGGCMMPCGEDWERPTWYKLIQGWKNKGPHFKG